MSLITRAAGILALFVLLCSGSMANEERQRCAAFYRDSTPGTVRISERPLPGTWNLLPYASAFSLEAGRAAEYWLVYNHKGQVGDGPSYLAAFEVSYLRHGSDLTSEVNLYRNKRWKREAQHYKAVPRYRNELRRSVTYPLPAGSCSRLLEAYRTARTYGEIDRLLAADTHLEPLFDGEPYFSNHSSLTAARALSSVTLRELDRCRESGASCMCQVHYMRFTPLQGKDCSDAPVTWYSTKDVAKSVFYMWSPHSPNMTGRIQVDFSGP